MLSALRITLKLMKNTIVNEGTLAGVQEWGLQEI
jgi:hypothetical protein